MPGPDAQRLVLLCSATQGADQARSFRLGTGYFLTRTIVITANHVLPEDATEFVVRVEKGEPQRHTFQRKDITRFASVDVALVSVTPGLNATSDVILLDAVPDTDQPWNSVGYPIAGIQKHQEDETLWKTTGLDGTWYVKGGGGQGEPELDLGVKYGAIGKGWGGVSGAPVFVGDKFAGILRDVPEDFDGKRLRGTPSFVLLQDPHFRNALAPTWLSWPTNKPWVLVLLAENQQVMLEERVRSAISKFNTGKDYASLTGLGELHDEPVVVSIVDAVDRPEHWLRLVQAICAAPVMILDITGLEPAVMLALGIRAVVRRGITITSTADDLDETHLSKLPFNIQETKLICYGEPKQLSEDKHPVTIISKAIRDGFIELHGHPQYLDLPAYDAVRYSLPDTANGLSPLQKTILVLCPFQEKYRVNWGKIFDYLFTKFSNRPIVRMLDIASPRLVGQALYEHIRWSEICVLDCTLWRANVFFELGVRLTCCDIDPICLIEESSDGIAGVNDLKQKPALLRLLGVSRYTLGNHLKSIDAAFRSAKHGSSDIPAVTPSYQLSAGAIYKVATDAFDWKQEYITLLPHTLLRRSAESELGKDPWKGGTSPILFGTNPAFSQNLRKSAQERWIAAWYYVKYRQSSDELLKNDAVREELAAFCESALQWIPRNSGDETLEAIRKDIDDYLQKIE